jgi:hypothetical protein
MGMKLTAQQMRDIAEKVDQINQLDLEVKTFAAHGHDVYLQRQPGGSEVVGITNKQQSGSSIHGLNVMR